MYTKYGAAAGTRIRPKKTKNMSRLPKASFLKVFVI